MWIQAAIGLATIVWLAWAIPHYFPGAGPGPGDEPSTAGSHNEGGHESDDSGTLFFLAGVIGFFGLLPCTVLVAVSAAMLRLGGHHMRIIALCLQGYFAVLGVAYVQGFSFMQFPMSTATTAALITTSLVLGLALPALTTMLLLQRKSSEYLNFHQNPISYTGPTFHWRPDPTL